MSGLFIQQLTTAPWSYFSWVLVVVFSICVHEYAHAAVALRRGDDTAARAGHLTLNPLVQMGPVSLVVLAVAGIAWGAVPVNTGRFRRRTDAALVAFSGPLANLVLSILFALGAMAAARISGGSGGRLGMAAAFLDLGSRANAVLFVLNLLPAPMFDGWAILALAWPPLERWRNRSGASFSWVILAVIFLTPLLSWIWAAGDSLSLAIERGWLSLLG